MRPSRPINHFLSWLAGHELTVLLALAAFAFGVWMFAALADEVMEGGTQAMDRRLLLAMRQPDGSPIGPPAVQEAARDITALGGLAVLGLLTVLTAGYLALDGKDRMALFASASIATGLL